MYRTEAISRDTTCKAYLIKGTSAARIGNYQSQEGTMDMSMATALANIDPNHFRFAYPDLIEHAYTHRYACKWCHSLCDSEYCSRGCDALGHNESLIKHEQRMMKEQSKYRFTLMDCSERDEVMLGAPDMR